MDRRSYKINSIVVNGKIYSEVVIDPHYEEKHSEYITDELILDLVLCLNGRFEIPVDAQDGYDYYATIIELNKKQYRLIWLLEENAVYVGVVNAFRDSKGE
ncbi:MAG TPA: hypothetical protein VNJ01_00960 [Bacteriovoracaceae bacterium]|nr:hypothetical protein [Bacteriovoracaceae bacterium]